MNGRGRRQKGQRGEREFADKLSASFPENLRVRRNLAQSRYGGEDITPDMVPGFSIEVKWQEKFSLNAWWQQACAQAIQRSLTEGYEVIPVLAYKRNRVDWRIRVPLRLYVPYAHLNKTIDIDYDSFISVVRHEQQRFKMGTG